MARTGSIILLVVVSLGASLPAFQGQAPGTGGTGPELQLRPTAPERTSPTALEVNGTSEEAASEKAKKSYQEGLEYLSHRQPAAALDKWLCTSCATAGCRKAR